MSQKATGAAPLMLAVLMNTPELVRLFVDKGADVNTRDVNDTTALTAASAMGSEKVVKPALAKGRQVGC